MRNYYSILHTPLDCTDEPSLFAEMQYETELSRFCSSQFNFHDLNTLRIKLYNQDNIAYHRVANKFEQWHVISNNVAFWQV